jgi:hypothetical protein
MGFSQSPDYRLRRTKLPVLHTNHSLPLLVNYFRLSKIPKNWERAHAQFDHIRRFNQDNPMFQPQNYLILAEQVAKITYNASRGPAPFDFNSGWYIPSLAMKTALFFDDERIEEEVKSVILIFEHHQEFKKNLPAAQEFLTYKKIDNILWTDWDPIGIHDETPRDEYRGYIPEILRLKKSGADRKKLLNIYCDWKLKLWGWQGHWKDVWWWRIR